MKRKKKKSSKTRKHKPIVNLGKLVEKMIRESNEFNFEYRPRFGGS